jgi:hypothetical protein
MFQTLVPDWAPRDIFLVLRMVASWQALPVSVIRYLGRVILELKVPLPRHPGS